MKKIKFIKRNVNPKGVLTSDCTTRALSIVLDVDYNEALLLQVNKSFETGLNICDMDLVEKILIDKGFERVKVPRKRGNKCYKVKELNKLFECNNLLVSIRGHLTAIKNNELIDTWDCSESAVCRVYK